VGVVPAEKIALADANRFVGRIEPLSASTYARASLAFSIQILDSTGVSVNGVSVPEGVPAVGVDRSMRVRLMNIVARDRKEPNKP
jgi:hypothetical protein